MFRALFASAATRLRPTPARRLPAYTGPEWLEQRIAPAALVAKMSGTTLKLLGNPLDVAVTVTQVDGSITVMDGAKNLGTFDNVKNISGNIKNGGNFTIDLSDEGLAGSLNLKLTGSTTLDLFGGTLSGNVKIKSGSENQQITIHTGTAIGKNFSFTSSKASDTVVLQDDVVIGKNFALTGVENLQLGMNSNIEVGGALQINNQKNVEASTITGVGARLLVKGAFTYRGGNSSDTVEVAGEMLGGATFKGGNGDNTFVLGPTTQITGSLTVLGGKDADSFSFFNGSVSKNWNNKLGNGSNSLSYGILDTITVGGNFTVSAGSGNDEVRGQSSPLSISENVTLALGDGNNVADGRLQVLGKKVTLKGGSGADSFDFLESASNALIIGKLKAGGDSIRGSFFEQARQIKLDGGSGTDAFRLTSVNATSIVLSSFEVYGPLNQGIPA